MSSEICHCSDEYCDSKSDHKLHKHENGTCRHPDGTHHPIHLKHKSVYESLESTSYEAEYRK